MKMKKIILYFLILSLAFPFISVSAETDGKAIGIAVPGDMELLRSVPDGSFYLMNDIDMAGVAWKACAFSGTLDGNGHTISGLSPVPGEETCVAVDGNGKKYDAVCLGLFSALNGARITNLTLTGFECAFETPESCCFGAISGFADEAVIENCSVVCRASVRSGGGFACAGGVIGFGAAEISGCSVDAVISLTDSNEEQPQEQYLGGVIASGFANVRGCAVRLSAKTGVFGYAHDGGVMGMLAIHKKNGFHRWTIEDCSVEADFRLFEKPFRSGRRAYCREILGEQVHKSVTIRKNTVIAFSREEVDDIGLL